MKSVILTLSLTHFLISCSHNVSFRSTSGEKSKPIAFNLSLIHTLSSVPTDGDVHPATLPYYGEYEQTGRKLIYLATRHTSNIESKTHKGIDNIFERFKPEAVIVEVPPFEGELGEEILNRCDSERCVEGLYAYQKAKRLGINVIGGEPQHNEVLRVSLKNGLTEEEMIFFYTYRGVASWRQGDPERAYTPKKPIEEIRRYIKHNKIRLGLEGARFDYKDFVSIYLKNMRTPFDFKKTLYVDIAPYKDGHYIQKLSVVVDKAREESILKKTENLINSNNRVFIIYGSGHFLKHRPVLKNAFISENVISL